MCNNKFQLKSIQIQDYQLLSTFLNQIKDVYPASVSGKSQYVFNRP